MFKDILVEIASALAVGGILWVLGLPRLIAGWLVGFVRRIAAKRHVASGYFDDAVISHSVKHYVRPSFQDVDPSIEAEPEHALIRARGDLFSMLSQFLSDRELGARYLLILADSGMGKTSFLINYFAWTFMPWGLWRRPVLLISLASTQADEQIRATELTKRKEFTLFLDALDEDARAIGRTEERLQEIFALTEGYRRVVITCRTQFFKDDEEIPQTTNIARIGPTSAGASKSYGVQRKYLSPFDERQVNDYLNKKFPGIFGIGNRSKARALVHKVPSLSVRPMLLAHMTEIMHAEGELKSTADIYKAMVDAWLEREKGWVAPAILMQFSLELAMYLYINREKNGGERADRETILKYARALGLTIEDDRLTGRSLLNRDSEGNYKFAHRSILEYLVARALHSLYGGSALVLTDQSALFLGEMLGASANDLRAWCARSECTNRSVGVIEKIGRATNQSLYRWVEFRSAGEVLSAGKRVFTFGGRDSSLEALINRMVAWISAKPADIRSVRISFARDSLKLPSRVYVTVWVGSHAVLSSGIGLIGEIEELSPYLVSPEVVISAEAPSGDKLPLRDWEWKRGTRVFYSAEADLPAARSSLYSNPAVSYIRDAESDRAEIRYLEEFVDVEHDISEFGILGLTKARRDATGFILVGPGLQRDKWVAGRN